jgi:hypothetical protein
MMQRHHEFISAHSNIYFMSDANPTFQEKTLDSVVIQFLNRKNENT